MLLVLTVRYSLLLFNAAPPPLRSHLHIPWTHPGYIPLPFLYTLHTVYFVLATLYSSSVSFLIYCPLFCFVSSFLKVSLRLSFYFLARKNKRRHFQKL
jgi:hypothetical protein